MKQCTIQQRKGASTNGITFWRFANDDDKEDDDNYY